MPPTPCFLTLLKEFAQATYAPECILISADQRLVRSAEAEGFKTINPVTCTSSEALQLLPAE